MSRKIITVASSEGKSHFVWTATGDVHDYEYRYFSGSTGRLRGSARSLSDAIEICKAMTSGSGKEISITDE